MGGNPSRPCHWKAAGRLIPTLPKKQALQALNSLLRPPPPGLVKHSLIHLSIKPKEKGRRGVSKGEVERQTVEQKLLVGHKPSSMNLILGSPKLPHLEVFSLSIHEMGLTEPNNIYTLQTS